MLCYYFILIRYVLNTYEYDDTMFQGPPRNIPRDEVFNLFGKSIILTTPISQRNGQIFNLVN